MLTIRGNELLLRIPYAEKEQAKTIAVSIRPKLEKSGLPWNPSEFLP